MKHRAFSLVEVALVVLILAILAGAMTLGVRGPLGRVGMRGLVDEIKTFDHLTRTYAREHDRPLRLVADLAGGRLRRTSEDGRDAFGEALKMPAGHRIAEVRLAGRRVTSGTVALSVSARGLSPTYALRVKGPGGREQWLLVAGLTGQVTEREDEREIEQILEALRAGHHAR